MPSASQLDESSDRKTGQQRQTVASYERGTAAELQQQHLTAAATSRPEAGSDPEGPAEPPPSPPREATADTHTKH